MDAAHEAVVTHQFGPRAAAYVESSVHASGEDLDGSLQTRAAAEIVKHFAIEADGSFMLGVATIEAIAL